jgi:sugar diacid utilization regulator
MMQINDILYQLHTILKCKLALMTEDVYYFYPAINVNPSGKQDMKDYNAWDIEANRSKGIFYTESGAEIDEAALSLAILYIKNQLFGKSNNMDSVIRLLSEEYNYSDVAVVNQLINKDKALYLILVSGVDIKSIENELLEVIRNSIYAKHIAEYQGNLIALVEDQNIYEACSDLQKNILTELFVESVIAIGGRLEQPHDMGVLYNKCSEVMLLKQSYGINQKVLDDQGMLLYRLINSIDKNQKENVVDKIFSSKFIELLNNEMELTIEEMFKNNLNLTDTSARLYIHRNTLLYRIDKIYKLTGFDLRKFEDSMIFKLAWLMYKEKQI